MSRLGGNVMMNRQLDNLVPLVIWEEGNKNEGFVKKVVKYKVEELATFYGYKPAMSYYFMKGVNSRELEKKVLVKLNDPMLGRQDFNKLNKQLNPEKEE